MDGIKSYLYKNRQKIESKELTNDDILEFLDLIAEVDTVINTSIIDDIEELYKRLIMYILFTGTNQLYCEMYLKIKMLSEKVKEYYDDIELSYYISKLDIKNIFNTEYNRVISLMHSLYIQPRFSDLNFIDISELIDKDKLYNILKKYASNRDIISDLGLLTEEAYNVWLQ